ncbi:MAG: alpha/beta fold hydrolase, partial [Alphaproteobacteria bacterium]|nr:alpha/beta fold hydrolase [Alphaproteobacteria bacterium]
HTTAIEYADRRFNSPNWKKPPYSILVQNFRAVEQWWDEAFKIHGVSGRHQALLAFLARQYLDIFSPTNGFLTNPDIVRRTVETNGVNLFNGWLNAIDDVAASALAKEKSRKAQISSIGNEVATSKGAVVARTRIAEIIQYTPTTSKVHQEPIVIVPAWIMKYYILDLSKQNSLVRYLVDQGFTVFMVSWKNPDQEDRDVSLDDYRTLGVLAAIDAAIKITGAEKVHGTGYCLGGTLLAIAAAAMARDGDRRLKTLSVFASQIDFHDAGELRLFINDSQLALIEDMMWMHGYLKAEEMAGAFHILRSNDLIWSRLINSYAMGEREKPLDIMLWSDDSTRMPYRMHSEYLRQLYLENRLAEGAMIVDGHPITLRAIAIPIFLVGTEWDHVAPWRSVFKLHLMTERDVTFVLTNGGHNAGIVSEPGHSGRYYRIATQKASGAYIDPDTWLEVAEYKIGSWWPEWALWLNENSPNKTEPPTLGSPLNGYPIIGPAPGEFVLG